MPPEPSEVKRSGVGSDLINGQTVNRKYSYDNYRISYTFDPTKTVWAIAHHLQP